MMAEPPSDKPLATEPHGGGDGAGAGAESARAAALALLLSDDERAMLDREVRLSSQERAVFALIGQGLRPKSVAHDLALSVKTIETHLKGIRAKLALSGKAPLSLPDLVFLARLRARARNRAPSGFS